MTPIFMRIWLMKITSVLVRLMLAVSFLSAWLMRRACRPICGSPLSPSISALGLSPAQRRVEAERTGGHDVDVPDRRVVHLHDGALAELLLDLRQRRGERLRFSVIHAVPLLLGCRHLRQRLLGERRAGPDTV